MANSCQCVTGSSRRRPALCPPAGSPALRTSGRASERDVHGERSRRTSRQDAVRRRHCSRCRLHSACVPQARVELATFRLGGGGTEVADLQRHRSGRRFAGISHRRASVSGGGPRPVARKTTASVGTVCAPDVHEPASPHRAAAGSPDHPRRRYVAPRAPHHGLCPDARSRLPGSARHVGILLSLVQTRGPGLRLRQAHDEEGVRQPECDPRCAPSRAGSSPGSTCPSATAVTCYGRGCPRRLTGSLMTRQR
jgi:hypothetical protein